MTSESEAVADSRGGEDDEHSASAALLERLLVLRAQTGSQPAFAELVARYDARLRFYLRRLLGSAADADDVRQEVWLAVLRKLHTLEDPGAFRTWLYTVARRRGISSLRGRVAELSLDAIAPEEQPIAQESEEPVAGPEDAAAVYAAIDTLPALQREILCLRFLAGLSYAEIAAVLACRVGTVRSRLHYAKAALRDALPNLRPARNQRGLLP